MHTRPRLLRACRGGTSRAERITNVLSDGCGVVRPAYARSSSVSCGLRGLRGLCRGGGSQVSHQYCDQCADCSCDSRGAAVRGCADGTHAPAPVGTCRVKATMRRISLCTWLEGRGVSDCPAVFSRDDRGGGGTLVAGPSGPGGVAAGGESQGRHRGADGRLAGWTRRD